MRSVFRPKWVEDVDAAVVGLTRDRTDWSSENHRPMDPATVSELAGVPHDVLPDDGPGPQIHPNRNSGAMAVWELSDACLEIELVPGRAVQYLYADNRVAPGLLKMVMSAATRQTCGSGPC